MATSRRNSSDDVLARTVRERFVSEVESVVIEMAATAQGRLSLLAEQAAGARDMQDRRDALLLFNRLRAAWVDGVRHAWRQALAVPAASPARTVPTTRGLSLVTDDDVENRIVASRLSLAILDKASWELNDLRLRVRQLEKIQELPAGDVFQPETLPSVIVGQWSAAGLTREVWLQVVDSVQPLLVERLVGAYHHANEFLVRSGVLPEIDLKPLVRRAAGGSSAAPSGSPPGSRRGGTSAGDATPSGPQEPIRAGSQQGALPSGGTRAGPFSTPAAIGGAVSHSSGGHSARGGQSTGLHDETRMMTATSPLARARQRAQGVLGQLRRLLGDRVAGFDQTQRAAPSGELAQAMDNATGVDVSITSSGPVDAGSVVRLSSELRQRSNELKRKAANPAEKATIEIVALMFQAILAEERIPAGVRVLFARLQMPVLRVAMSEPEFFGTLQHPARRLIDRMGGCVMGFDASAVQGGALEAEIRRVVQVIEQYPETGRRVFQLVLDEFQKFLASFLTEKDSVQKMVSVAQQVEQKEALSVQYTIELRKLLGDMRVREEIREFLFRVWADVLAVAAVKQGAQHASTQAFKRAAADLVWAASAKPNRDDRAKVIQDLPGILQRLREGMALLGLPASRQDAHIKVLGDTLADAFMSRTEAIPQDAIDAMARRLENLEVAVMDGEADDIALDADAIELMLGVDASSFEILANGGSQPGEAMLAWVHELSPGEWFMLDHNGQLTQVQLVWRSDRRQLHLFASADGRNFLVQARRLAAYLQAGLLVPSEEEALTVRATRKALAKLDANPERLLG
jgi:hypothetical protein